MKLLTVICCFWLSSVVYAQQPGFCNEQINPHSFECHEAAYLGMSEFPVMNINWPAMFESEWFAVTYAIQGSNSGRGFIMDKNPFNPNRPGRGVLNLMPGGFTSVVGELSIHGGQVVFQNWQGFQLASNPGSLRALDAQTMAFDAIDSSGIQHTFTCRDFLRENTHHLDCRWYMRLNNNAPWILAGYFGFLTRQAWDDFESHGG